MKILVTGGAGFIGSETVNQLFSVGTNDITVLDSMTEQIHGINWENSYLYKSIEGKCNLIKGDIRDFETVKNVVKDKEVIIHLAAETGTGQSMYMINQYNEVNIMGTSNLLQAISLLGKENKVRKIILSSSRSVYGEGKYECANCGVIYPDSRSKDKMLRGDYNLYCPHCGAKLKLLATTENDKVNPSSLYAYTKYAQEMMLTGILSVFSSLLLENKPLNIFEDGLESRDFINVKDVAGCVIGAISNERSNRETINLGSGINTSVIEIAEILRKYYQSTSEINVTGDFRIGDIAHNKADISKAKTIFGFSPAISLEQGLKDFCGWVMGQERDCSKYENSLSEMEDAGLFIRKKE